MLATSFVFGVTLLVAVHGMPPELALPAVAAGAVVGAATELVTPSKYDTVSVPVAVLAVLLVFLG